MRVNIGLHVNKYNMNVVPSLFAVTHVVYLLIGTQPVYRHCLVLMAALTPEMALLLSKNDPH